MHCVPGRGSVIGAVDHLLCYVIQEFLEESLPRYERTAYTQQRTHCTKQSCAEIYIMTSLSDKTVVFSRRHKSKIGGRDRP